MGFILAVCFVLLAATNAVACGNCNVDSSFLNSVSLQDPASYRLAYTGLYGLAMDEYVNLVSRQWLRDIIDRRDYRQITESEAQRHFDNWSGMLQDYSTGAWSDRRHYPWHYASSWAQPLYIKGPSSDLINFGPFRVNSKFKFKLKDYEAQLSRGWKFKSRPRVRFTLDPPFIRRAAGACVFTYRVRHRKLIRASLRLGYGVEDNEGLLQVIVELPSWG